MAAHTYKDGAVQGEPDAVEYGHKAELPVRTRKQGPALPDGEASHESDEAGPHLHGQPILVS